MTGNGQTWKRRYDSTIDAKCNELGNRHAELSRKGGPEYEKFVKEEYTPTLASVNSYLLGETDKHPLK